MWTFSKVRIHYALKKRLPECLVVCLDYTELTCAGRLQLKSKVSLCNLYVMHGGMRGGGAVGNGAEICSDCVPAHAKISKQSEQKRQANKESKERLQQSLSKK
jgi:hypothetical protein